MASKEEICINLAQAFLAYIDLLKAPSEPQAGNKLYTFEEIGKMMGKSKDTIRRWVCAGKFGEPVKAGNSTRITQAGLDKFLADNSDPIQKQQHPPRRKCKVGFNPKGEPFGI